MHISTAKATRQELQKKKEEELAAAGEAESAAPAPPEEPARATEGLTRRKSNDKDIEQDVKLEVQNAVKKLTEANSSDLKARWEVGQAMAKLDGRYGDAVVRKFAAGVTDGCHKTVSISMLYRYRTFHTKVEPRELTGLSKQGIAWRVIMQILPTADPVRKQLLAKLVNGEISPGEVPTAIKLLSGTDEASEANLPVDVRTLNEVTRQTARMHTASKALIAILSKTEHLVDLYDQLETKSREQIEPKLSEARESLLTLKTTLEDSLGALVHAVAVPQEKDEAAASAAA